MEEHNNFIVWHIEHTKSHQLGKQVQLQSGVCSDMDEHGTFVLCDFAHCVKSLATQYAKTGKNITKKMRNKNGKNVQVCMYVIYGHFYKLGQFSPVKFY